MGKTGFKVRSSSLVSQQRPWCIFLDTHRSSRSPEDWTPKII